MRFAGFLPLLVLLASYKHADGNVYDDMWRSLKAFSSKLDRQANVTENLETIIENQAKIFENQAKMFENQSKIIENQAIGIEELKKELSKTQMSNAAIETQLKKHSADLLTHDNRLKSHDAESDANWNQILKCIHDAGHTSSDCVDVQVMGCTESGVYTVFPVVKDKRINVKVFCEFGKNQDSWLIFQRRKDGSVDFERTWVEYERGFGSLYGEFWLGNEALSLLTTNRKYKLRIDMEDFSGQKRYAEYSTFSVGPASEKYRLTVAGYSGNAGDSFSFHNGMKFSTKDADNDASSDTCALAFRGAWWYKDCHYSNLNGLYLEGKHTSRAVGVTWYTWHGWQYSFKKTEMKITRVA